MVEEARGLDASNVEDLSWVQAFQAGDQNGFDRLVLKYQDKVFHLCYRLLAHHEDATDTAQEAFVKACLFLKGFRLETVFSTWLARIVVRTAKNKLTSSEYRYHRKMMRPGQHPSEAGRPPLEQKGKEKLVQDALDALPEEERVILLLRDLEGLPYLEIAHVMGVHRGSVKSKLARARQAVKEKLNEVVG